jgi:hypothetical protein
MAEIITSVSLPHYVLLFVITLEFAGESISIDSGAEYLLDHTCKGIDDIILLLEKLKALAVND